MKKLLAIFLLFSIVFAAKSQTVSLTAYQKNRAVNADSSQDFNPEWIVDAYVSTGGKTYITYDEFKSGLQCEYTVRENLDTIQKRANRGQVNLFRLRKAQIVSGTDSFVTYLFNAHNYKGSYTRATSGLSYAASKMKYKQFTNVILIPIVESKATIKALKDSSDAAKSDVVNSTHYDTATYTMKSYETTLVFKSTTADTLTLLNPNLFVDKGTLWVRNIGTGTYTVVGGFTVQDKSASTFSLFAATSIYALKAYYNGSAYVWSVAKVE